jgi:hypothetical protein
VEQHFSGMVGNVWKVLMSIPAYSAMMHMFRLMIKDLKKMDTSRWIAEVVKSLGLPDSKQFENGASLHRPTLFFGRRLPPYLFTVSRL